MSTCSLPENHERPERRLRIAMANALLPSEEKAGVPYQVHHLANTLVARGHEVTLFSFSPRPHDALYEHTRLPRIPRLRKFDSFVFAYRLAKTDFTDFDLLHVHGDNYFLWWTHPQVRTFHGSAADEAASAVTLRRKAFFRVIHPLEQVGMRVADRSVGISQTTRRRFSAMHAVIPCGVDLAVFKPGAKTLHPTVLFVGTAEGRKRGRFLAEVFAREVKPRVPSAELLMVCDAPVRGDGVRYLGKVSLERLAELYRSSWLFCLPSSYEGFGVPYVEAMASGTAVLASPNAGAREVLDEGRYGVLAADADLGSSLAAMLTDDVLREKLSQAGLARAREFRWERCAKLYEQIYASVVSAPISRSVVGGRQRARAEAP